MGGFGSGNRQARGGRPTTASRRSIDVRRWASSGRLVPGLRFEWRWHAPRRSVHVSCLVGPDAVRLFVTTLDRGAKAIEVGQLVKLEATPCRFGGARRWWVCPRCAGRAALLYLGDAGRFACRRCLGLTYQSRNETPAQRVLSRAKDARVRLGGTGSMGEPFPDKPKGMHWRTYERLARKAIRAEIALEAWTNESLGRSRIPHDAAASIGRGRGSASRRSVPLLVVVPVPE